MNLPNIKESDIQNAIIELLQRSGYIAWRNSVGARKFKNQTGEARWVRFGQPGFSDIFAIQPGTGKFVALECKVPTKKHSATPEQLKFIEQVKAQGGIAAVVCSSEEAATLLKIPGLF